VIDLTASKLEEAHRLLRRLRYAHYVREAAWRAGDPERMRATRHDEAVIERRLSELLPARAADESR